MDDVLYCISERHGDIAMNDCARPGFIGRIGARGTGMVGATQAMERPEGESHRRASPGIWYNMLKKSLKGWAPLNS